jgi:elongation factor Ts
VEFGGVTPAVAARDEFAALVKEIAMQIAAANPRSVRREELPAELIEQERQIYASQAVGKPEALINKIVDGKLEKFFAEFCLYEQAWVRDPNRRIKDLIGEFSGKLGEKLEVRRFVRFQLGENIDAKGPASAAE